MGSGGNLTPRVPSPRTDGCPILALCLHRARAVNLRAASVLVFSTLVGCTSPTSSLDGGVQPSDGAPDARPADTEARADASAPDASGRDADVLDEETFVRAWAQSVCTTLARCGLAAPDEQARCAEVIALTRSRPPTGSRFDAAAAARCLANIGLDCDTSPLQPNQNCSAVFVPVVAAGESCERSVDCASPTLLCDGASCASTCAPFGAEGGPCLADGAQRFCAPGLRCDAMLRCAPLGSSGESCRDGDDCRPGLQCAGGVCAAGAAVGQPCPPLGSCSLDGYCDASVSPSCLPIVALGGACASNASCGVAAFCLEGVCAPRLPADAGCANDRQCTADLRCSAGRCGVPSLVDGAACADASGCAAPLVCDVIDHRCRIVRTTADGAMCTGHTLRCDASGRTRCVGGVCVERGAGDPCDVTMDLDGRLVGSHNQCPPTMSCRVVDSVGTCTPSAIGSPCHFGRNCAVDQFCDLQQSCTARRPSGAACGAPRDCAEGLTCDLTSGGDDPEGSGAGTCVAIKGAGSTCSASCPLPLVCLRGACARAGLAGEACVGGACFDGACTDGVCVGKVVASGPCQLDAQCESAVCAQGQCAAVCR